MNGKIYRHLKAYNEKNGWKMNSDEDMLETLEECGEIVFKNVLDERRWWSDVFKVTFLDGMLIGFNSATTTGDDSPKDKGWEFDPTSICEVERHEETKVVVTYTPVDSAAS